MDHQAIQRLKPLAEEGRTGRQKAKQASADCGTFYQLGIRTAMTDI